MQRIASIAAIVTHHAEDAAFLWSRRRREVDGQILGEDDIGRIDQRIDASLEGLFASGESAWKIAVTRFSDYADSAELFVMGALALHWGSDKAIAATMEAAASIGEKGVQGMSGAIARTRHEKLRPYVAKWLDAKEPMLVCLGLSALWHHGTDPGARLGEFLVKSDRAIRIRAIRLAGAIKRRDVLPVLMNALDAADVAERLVAAEAISLLGGARDAYPVLDKLTLAPENIAARAFRMRLLTTPGRAGQVWLQERLDQVALRAQAVAVIGMVGEKSIMPWLVDKMHDPSLAHAAGLALRDLFEVDFNDTDLFTTDLARLGKEFENVMDSPLPIADRVEAWWDEGRGPGKHAQFHSMRRQMLDSYRKALKHADAPLGNWRRTRQFPAWM